MGGIKESYLGCSRAGRSLRNWPILFGAVIINFITDLSWRNLITATIVLALCLFFLFYGSGKHSADYYLKMQQ